MQRHILDAIGNTPLVELRRIALTLSGHTHGRQVRVLGWSPISLAEYLGASETAHYANFLAKWNRGDGFPAIIGSVPQVSEDALASQ